MALKFGINILGILTVAILSMIIGALWYGPLFGKMWMKLSGFSKKDIKKAKQKGIWKNYSFAFIASLLMAFVLSVFIKIVGAITIFDGAVVGIWVWLGFIITIQFNSVLWEGKSLKLYMLNIGSYLVTLSISGAILSIWDRLFF